MKLKVMTILGTRPEIIRLSRVLVKMDEYFNHIVVFTSQSYDYELSDIFFKELNLRKPNYTLSVKADSLGKQIGNIISQTEEVMIKEKPDALLVLGDTNSALSAIMAKRLKIPIFHMEAGNRSFDFDVPEEINRRIVDHISDYNLAYTEHSRRYLLQEGILPETIFVTGSPLTEVFDFYKQKILESKILTELSLSEKKYFVVSSHREENVDTKENLEKLFSSLNALAEEYKLPIVVSLHPRTKKRFEEANISVNKLIQLHKPFGYFDYCALQKNALCVLSDSGTIQEESAILDFPAIQIRVSTERPEAFDSGSILLSGLSKDSILSAVNLVIKETEKGEKMSVPFDYHDKQVSGKVVKLIMGLSSIKKYHGRKFGR
ncbi:MAG TPA: UDP-N-acetylglucosamine 2-epimerase (non-hydrolyzing) [Patescibacteria group bacterium]